MQEVHLLSIEDLNKILIYDFTITFLHGLEDVLIITGDREYPDYFRVEIRFIDVVYVACAPSFFCWDYRFRMATEEEAARLQDCTDTEDSSVYCFEELTARLTPPLKRNARNYFIIAKNVKIVFSCEEGKRMLY